MALKASLILAGISVILLVIYGADVMVGGGGAGKGFLPFDAMSRGIGFGGTSIVLSIVAFFISRKESSKILGVLVLVSGILIIIGGATSLSSMTPDNTARMIGEGGSLIGVGAFIAALGIIKIRK